jgi:hypothetical protein
VTEEELPKPGEPTNKFVGVNGGTVYQIRNVKGDVVHVENVNIVSPPPVPVLEPAPPRSPARQLLPFVPHLILAVLVGSLASILVVYHQSALFRGLAVLAALAPFALLLAVLPRRWRLIERCTPQVLRDAATPALVALAVLMLLFATGLLIWPPRFFDGNPQRDAIVLALLFTDVTALSVAQVVRRFRER